MGFLFQAVGMGNVDKKCLLVGAWMPLMGGLASRLMSMCLPAAVRSLLRDPCPECERKYSQVRS